MNFKRILNTCIACLFFCSGTFAQRSDKIIWTVDNDLLPQNSVKSIVPDKYGYLWLSTENGLVRYDGKSYKIYNSQNLKLNSNRMLYIQGEQASDSLFVTTHYAQDLLLIHNRKVTRIDSTMIPNTKMYLNTDGRIYNSSGSYGVDLNDYDYKISLSSLHYYIITKKSITYFSPKGTTLTSFPIVGVDSENFFVLGEALYYFKNEKEYAVIKQGNIQWKKLSQNFSSDFQIIWSKASNQAFLLSDDALKRIDIANEQLTFNTIIKVKQLKSKNILTAYYDEAIHTLFLGSSTNGLGIYQKPDFKTISYLDYKHSSVFYALQPLTDKSIITSTGLELNKDSIVRQHDFINSGKIAMNVDQKKNIWLISHNEIYRYNANADYKKYDEYFFSSKVQTLYQENPDKIWITLGKGIENKSQLIYFKPEEKPLFKNYCTVNFRVNYIAKNTENKIWLAGSKGLYLLNYKSNTLKHIKGTEKIDVRSVLQTTSNEVWISTYEHGFYVLQNNILHKLPVDKNGYLSTTHFIMEDEKGFFWITTNKGLFQVKKDVLLSYIKNPEQTIYYHYYNKDAGFLTNEFNGGSSPYSAQLGSQFFFPSMNGIVTFDTNKIKALEPKNPIYVDEIKVDNEILEISDNFNLPNTYQRVTLTFSSPYYGNEFNTNFYAKLEGPTNIGWTALSEENKFSFTKLPPGSYTVTIRKLSGFDSTFNYKKISIEIAPLFYQTTWFAIVALIISILLIYGALKIYSNSVRARNRYLKTRIKEKTEDLQNTIKTLRSAREQMKTQADKNNKLIQIISHDIKSPLKFMSMASKYMYDDFDPNSADLKENILAIHTSSSQIYNFLENILSYTKVNTADGELENESFLLHEEIENKIKLFKNIANAEKTQLINLVPQSLKLNTNKSLFAIIIHNILDNALKHTSTGKIEFSAEQNDEQVSITIQDQGIGMTPEVLSYYQSVFRDFDLYKNKSNKRLGLHLVAELMLVLNGTIKLESTEGFGTSLQLHFNNQTGNESS